MRAMFEHFSSSTESWDTLFSRAADFATKVGPDRLITISHSHGGGSEMWGSGGVGVVTVWYWDQAKPSSRPD